MLKSTTAIIGIISSIKTTIEKYLTLIRDLLQLSKQEIDDGNKLRKVQLDSQLGFLEKIAISSGSFEKTIANIARATAENLVAMTPIGIVIITRKGVGFMISGAKKMGFDSTYNPQKETIQMRLEADNITIDTVVIDMKGYMNFKEEKDEKGNIIENPDRANYERGRMFAKARVPGFIDFVSGQSLDSLVLFMNTRTAFESTITFHQLTALCTKAYLDSADYYEKAKARDVSLKKLEKEKAKS